MGEAGLFPIAEYIFHCKNRLATRPIFELCGEANSLTAPPTGAIGGIKSKSTSTGTPWRLVTFRTTGRRDLGRRFGGLGNVVVVLGRGFGRCHLGGWREQGSS